MALSSVTEALAQYNANLSWHTSRASAELALEAVRYLLVNRAQRMQDESSSLDFTSLESEKKSIEQFLGAGVSRAFGRRRVLKARFADGSVQ